MTNSLMSPPGVSEPTVARTRWLPTRGQAVRIAVWYGVLSSGWVLGSSWALHHWVHDPNWVALLEDVKGWGFVVLTALLLGLGLDRVFRGIRQAVHDITQSEERLRLITETIDEVFWMADVPLSQMVYISPAYERVWGRSTESLRREPRSFVEGIHPEDRPRVVAGLRAQAAGQPFEQEYRVVRPDGTLRWVLDRGFPLRNAAGAITHYVGLAKDVTERKVAELALRQSEERFSKLFHASPSAKGISRLDDGRFVDVNEAFVQLYGYSREELLGHTSDELGLWHSSNRAQVVQELREQKRVRRLELQGRRKDGTVRDLLASLELLDLGGVACMVGSLIDITELKQAATALRRSERNYREIFNATNEAIFLHDAATGQILDVNEAMLRLYGFERKEQVTAGDFEQALKSKAAYNLEAALRRLRLAIEEGPQVFEWLAHKRNGDPFWVEVSLRSSQIGGEGRVLAVVRDITERKQLQVQFQQAQKMEAVGKLAGGVAHDFNNLLAVMLMQTELAAGAAQLPVEVQEGLVQIRAAATRAANLTRQLLLFSRKQVMQARDLDLNEVVTNLAKMLRRTIGEDIELQLHLHSNSLVTHADAGMLDQVLLNLVVNARDAMPAGGRLLIETAEKTLVTTTGHPHPDAAPGRYVWLSVTDSGCGIPPEVLPRIFEPFFTTKEVGKGTGLGLATVFGIVKQHRGWLEVESQPGQGSRFQIFLPASSAVVVDQKEAATPHARGGSETILLAEDDPALRLITRRLLEKQGYKVLSAADGPAALQLWDQHRPAVALLVTDLVMPGGMSGHQLARQLQADKPGLKVIYTSGYSPEIAGQGIELRPGENFVQKPYPPHQLLDSIRRCLDG